MAYFYYNPSDMKVQSMSMTRLDASDCVGLHETEIDDAEALLYIRGEKSLKHMKLSSTVTDDGKISDKMKLVEANDKESRTTSALSLTLSLVPSSSGGIQVHRNVVTNVVTITSKTQQIKSHVREIHLFFSEPYDVATLLCKNILKLDELQEHGKVTFKLPTKFKNQPMSLYIGQLIAMGYEEN